MWECWTTGDFAARAVWISNRPPQAGTRNAQSRFGGWVEISVPAARGAATARLGFPRAEDWDRALQHIHRKRCVVDNRLYPARILRGRPTAKTATPVTTISRGRKQNLGKSKRRIRVIGRGNRGEDDGQRRC